LKKVVQIGLLFFCTDIKGITNQISKIIYSIIVKPLKLKVMKTRLILSVMLLVVSAFVSQAQHYRTNGMPDMRYRENRSTYGTSYSTPTTTALPAVRYQSGYQRSDGTAVNSHYKTESNNTNWDNFSTKGNSNPYSGESGSRARDYSIDASNYGSGKTIQTGSRGGQYYINGNGGKTYVPKQPW
jgi:hypothetical protein